MYTLCTKGHAAVHLGAWGRATSVHEHVPPKLTKQVIVASVYSNRYPHAYPKKGCTSRTSTPASTLTFWYSGLALYLANSASQSASLMGGRSPGTHGLHEGSTKRSIKGTGAHQELDATHICTLQRVAPCAWHTNPLLPAVAARACSFAKCRVPRPSLTHSKGHSPANFHSVMDSPLRVSRVMPPSTTMLYTQTAVRPSQAARAVRAPGERPADSAAEP